jgi:hypothetical protein
MHVGYGMYCQNPDGKLSDAEVYAQEMRLADMAEPLGFDSLWSVAEAEPLSISAMAQSA